MQVNFRYSDTDFIAYMITIGYEYNNIEVVKDRYNKLKVFVYFLGDKNELINLQNEFKNGKAIINPLYFSINRKKINKLIKGEIIRYQDRKIWRSYIRKKKTTALKPL